MASDGAHSDFHLIALLTKEINFFHMQRPCVQQFVKIAYSVTRIVDKCHQNHYSVTEMTGKVKFPSGRNSSELL